MSADNWAICPRCLDQAKAAFAKIEERAAGVDADLRQFMTLRKPDAEDFRTFREEYQFYLPEGEYVVKYDYYGECQSCALSVSFQGEEIIAH